MIPGASSPVAPGGTIEGMTSKFVIANLDVELTYAPTMNDGAIECRIHTKHGETLDWKVTDPTRAAFQDTRLGSRSEVQAIEHWIRARIASLEGLGIDDMTLRQCECPCGAWVVLKPNAYALHVGKLVTNLSSLELLMRLFLHEVELMNGGSPPVPFGGKPGDTFAIGPLTNYDSLGPVIDKYNAAVNGIDPSAKVDRTFVRIRDMFAHGRNLSESPDGPMILHKFGDKDATTNLVPLNDVLACDGAWMTSTYREIHATAMRVFAAREAVRTKRTAAGKP